MTDPDIRLVRPSEEHEGSGLDMANDYRSEGLERRRVPRADESFPHFLARLAANEAGLELADGDVPDSVFWLLVSGRCVGTVSVRHQLTPELLQDGGNIGYDIRQSERRRGYGTIILSLALAEARKLGLGEVLVTCDETNIASRRIIERNGGRFEAGLHPTERRYWITT